MNLATIALAYLRTRPLNTLLNVLLLALGVAVLVILLLVGHGVTERLTRDARDIHLVVGAKGSPLQLVLSAVYHLDVPPGNIPLATAMEVARQPHVKHVIPLALGDSFRGFRIVGTTPDLIALYGGTIAHGAAWTGHLEAVVGADVARASGLAPGTKFVGTHGLGGDGDAHDGTPYTVTGVLSPTGTVLDRLVLGSVESVWLMHMHLEADERPEQVLAVLTDAEKEITALIVQYASPLAALSLPRWVNRETAMQAASPAVETARLFTLLGVGIDVLRGFALVLVCAAALSTFIALYNALDERRYDLAVMRMLGASRWRLLALVLLEGSVLAGIGGLLGIVAGHAGTGLIGLWLAAGRQPGVDALTFLPEEAWILGGALLTGMLAALLPAWRACRRDVAQVLAGASC